MAVSVTLTFPDAGAALDALGKLCAPFNVVAKTLDSVAPMAGMNATEVRERATEIAVEAKIADIPQEPTVMPERPLKVAERYMGPATEQATKRRGRPPKAETVSTAPAPAAVITKEEALAKFKETNDAKGLAVCRAILTRLGANRFAVVRPEQYPEFVKLCDRAISGDDLTAASE